MIALMDLYNGRTYTRACVEVNETDKQYIEIMQVSQYQQLYNCQALSVIK